MHLRARASIVDAGYTHRRWEDGMCIPIAGKTLHASVGRDTAECRPPTLTLLTRDILLMRRAEARQGHRISDNRGCAPVFQVHLHRSPNSADAPFSASLRVFSSLYSGTRRSTFYHLPPLVILLTCSRVCAISSLRSMRLTRRIAGNIVPGTLRRRGREMGCRS